MTIQNITIGNTFQGGRVNAPDPSVGPTYIRYASLLLAADTYNFQFPQGSASGLTFGVPLTVFIDNANNPFGLVVLVGVTGQTFPVPASSTGFYVIDAIAGSTITVTSAGNSSGIVEFIYYNYVRQPIVWYAFGAATGAVTIANGADVALGSTIDAAIINPATNGTVISFIRGLLTENVAILAKLNSGVAVTLAALGYEACPASATTTLGTAGAVGDYLDHIVVYPGTTSPGNVIINDNVTAIGTFPGGASSVSNLVPFIIPVGANCVGNKWTITTGANVTVLAVGRFT